MKKFVVYIMTNKKYGTLYIGVTSNLSRRSFEHKNGTLGGFCKKYNLDKLVYYEIYDEAVPAITREKKLKLWKRAWKIELIESMNPQWNDLVNHLIN